MSKSQWSVLAGLASLVFLVYCIAGSIIFGAVFSPVQQLALNADTSSGTPSPFAPTSSRLVTAIRTSTRINSTSTVTSTPDRTSASIANPQRVQATVVSVVDGDTIHVSISGRAYVVRYIGMDAPETVAPGRPAGCMGPEASAANKALVQGKTVFLEKDVSETDRYGRLLRYVYVGDLFVNAELVRQGYAQVSTFPPDVKYQSLFLQLQQEARNAKRGLWGSGSPASNATPTLINPKRNCDRSYPDVCISSPPPDLNCKDIPYKKFRVLYPDPHNFDTNHNGIGCES